MAKKIIFFSLLSLFCLSATGCWGKRETDEAAYVLAIAMDKGEKDKLKMTLQIANPQAAASAGGAGGGPSGGPDKKPFIITSIEAPSVIGGLNLLNSITSRELSLMHTKAIIYSSELAREGIEKYLAPLVRYREVRRTTFVFVSRGKAGEFLKENQPFLESIPSKYFEQMERGSRFTGFIPSVQLHSFYECVKSMAYQPVATLVDVNREAKQAAEKEEEKEERKKEPAGASKDQAGGENEKSRDRPHEGHYLAGEVPRTGDNPVELMGAAIFKGDKMVGEINGEETRLMLMLRGDFRRGFLTIPDPGAEGRIIVLDLRQPVHPRVKIEMEDGRPRIAAAVSLEAEFLSIQSVVNYEKPELKKEIENEINKYVEEHGMALIKKSQEEFKSDCLGFGRFARRLVSTREQWEELNWPELYPEAEVDLQVQTRIRRTGLLVKMTPVGGGGS